MAGLAQEEQEEGRREGWIEKEGLLGKVGFTRKDLWSGHHGAVTLSKRTGHS